MKRLLLLICILVSILYTNCTKNTEVTDNNPHITPPLNSYYAFHADTVGMKGGTVTPINASVATGSSFTAEVRADSGNRISLLTVDNIPVALTDEHYYMCKFSSFSSNHSLKAVFTDFLTQVEWNAKRDLLIGEWYDIFDSVKVSGSLGPFGDLPIPNCALDSRGVYVSDGTATNYAGSHPCDTALPGSVISKFTWTLSSNGKQIICRDENGNVYIINIISLTSARLVTSYDDGRYIYLITAEHKPKSK